MQTTFNLQRFNAADAAFFCDMLPYVSPHVHEVCRDGNEVLIGCTQGSERDLYAKMEQLAEMVVGRSLENREVPVRTLADYSDVPVLNAASIFERLVASGAVREICPGVFAYGGIYLSIYRYFSQKIDAFAHTTFADIEEFEFPVLYPIADFEKGRYFETFPHFIMFQTAMRNDLDVLDRFATKGARDPAIFAEMSIPKNVLRHACCVPVYQFLAGKRIAADTAKAFLVSGRCFRNEASNVVELARLNEFFMKEYVFLGEPDACKKAISQARELWDFWIKTFALNCKIETANDSFFASNHKKLSYFQQIGESKQEFKWLTPSLGDYIACSSINSHRTHFSKPYSITSSNGDLCYSSCIAFGIDRLAYALLAQKGLNPDDWDDATRTEVDTYVKL
jgi:hypothetical protein